MKEVTLTDSKPEGSNMTIEYIGGVMDGGNIKLDGPPQTRRPVTVNGVTTNYCLQTFKEGKGKKTLVYIAEGYHGKLINED